MEEFRGGKVPAVLALVLYNGEREWMEALETRERIALEPGSDGRGVARESGGSGSGRGEQRLVPRGACPIGSSGAA